MTEDLTDRRREILDELPATPSEVVRRTAYDRRIVAGELGWLSQYDYAEKDGSEWVSVNDTTDDPFEWGALDDDTDTIPDWADTPVAETDPDPDDLTDRESYILGQLKEGTTPEALAEDLDERPSVVTQHLRDLRAQGWAVYQDDTADLVSLEGEHTLRSAEHKGTRTRKANRWWERRHSALVREWKAVEPIRPTHTTTPAGEDWVLHLTDLHAGDKVRAYDGQLVHRTEILPDAIDYVTEKSLTLADKHNADYDTGVLLWGGDFVTNEGIYEGQFEDLDAWLDEQVDILFDPLRRQLKSFADRFPTVRVCAVPGNHGDVRASGTSKRANADLILFKALRNQVAALQQEGVEWAQRVSFDLAEARKYLPFALRDGAIHGQLRHGQDRKPQAETSARLKEWLSTLLDSARSDWGHFDVCWIGHHHVSGRIPWGGPPIIVSGTVKPTGEYVREIGEAGQDTGPRQVATTHGVNDDGLTSIWPIDLRDFEP